MRLRRFFSALLALLMVLSTFAEILPADAMASQLSEEAVSAQSPAGEVRHDASYNISMDDVTITEDGALMITLPESASADAEQTEVETEATEPRETEPAVTEPQETEPEETEPEETEPEETEPEETEPEETEPEETEPEETEPEETEPEETEPEEVVEPLTWFQWIEEKGVDISGLSKEEMAALEEEYSAYRINTLAEMGVLPEGASSGTIANDYLEVSVHANGHFTMGTRIGNPDYTSDNYKKLLYGHPNSDTSETLIYIDNGSYSNYFYADTISYSYDTATATMNIPSYNLKVVQTLKFVKSDGANFKDTVQIQYQVVNSDSRSHDVGIRVMMDTMLANNDHATFRVSSEGNITRAKVYTGASIPSVYQVYDDLDNPTTLATGYPYRSGDTKPSKIQFCNWGNIRGSGWNHHVSDGDYLGDSAVGIYFNPKTIRSGKSMTVRTYYGVSVGVGDGSAEEIQDDQVKITVKDNESREPLSGVSVKCLADGQVAGSGTTGENGVVVLTGWNRRDITQDEPVPMTIRLVMEMDGYKTSTVNCDMEGGSQYVYYMSKDGAKKPVVNGVVLKTDNGQVDLLTKTCKYLEDGDGLIDEKGATGTVTIKATSDMTNCTWMLIQDEKVLQRNASGEFVLNVRKTDDGTYIQDLQSGTYLYVQAVSADGKESKKMRLGLKVVAKTTKVEFFPLDLGELFPEGGSKIAEGTLAAIFLGNKFSFGLGKKDNLDFQVELVDGGKVRVGLNFNAKEWDTLNKKLDGGKTKGDMIKELQNEMKEYATNKKKRGIADKTGKLSKFSFGNAEAEFTICGYGEGSLENGKVRIDLTVFMALKGELKHTTQFLVGTIPCYIQVGGKAEGKLQGSANLLNSEGAQFQLYDASFTPALGVWLEGGAGIKGAVSVGAKGEGTVSLEMDLVNAHQLAQLEAQASIVAEVVFWEKEIPFVKKTIILYDSNDKDGTVYGADENIYEMLEAIPFRLVTREEMAGENAEGGASSTGTQVRLLNVDGTQYKFFLADRGGDQINRFMLSYSKLVDGVWSDAVPVADDNTTDVYYDVATDGTNIYVVWSNSSKRFEETAGLDEMFAAQEICFTTIASDGTTAQPLTLTSDSAMDIMPAVTVFGNSAYVAWYHTANGIEDNTDVADHYLYYTTVTGGQAAAVSNVNCENAAISSVHAATVNGVPVATYVTNDSDAYTIRENVTHEINMSSGTVQTVDSADKTVGKAVTAVIDGSEHFFWMEDGNIAYAVSMNAETPRYVFAEEDIPGTINTDNYAVINYAGKTWLIWAESRGEAGNVAMTAVYADGSWSNAYWLTDLAAGDITNLTGYENADGGLVLVYTAKDMYNASEEDVEVSTATLEKVVQDTESVSITDLTFDIADAIPGENLPLTVTVENTGNTRIDSLSVNINSAAGENFNSQLTGVNLAPGMEKTLQIAGFTLSSSLTTRNTYQGQYVYTVTMTTENAADHAQETFEIGYDNVLLYKQELALVDGRENIVIAVENASGFPASDVHVRVLSDTTDGVLIYDNVFDEIRANGRVTIYLDVEELNSTKLYASVSSASTASEPVEYTEIFLSDSSRTATLTVDVYGCGTVNPAAPMEYAIGEEVALTATANSGYAFDGWYSYRDLEWVTGNADSANAQIRMPSGDTTVTARFVSLQPHDFALDKAQLDMKAGAKVTLDARFASPETTGKVIWSSSDETVATVSSRGEILALAEGTCVITAACGTHTHTCTVTVTYENITSVRMVYPQMNLEVGEMSSLEVITDPANSEGSLQWVSSDESIAVVDRFGNVTAKAYGSAMITATSFKNPDVKAECTVNVIMPVTDILLDNHELVMSLEDNVAQLNVEYEPADANYGQDIIWSVDDSSILSLSASGEHNEKLTITALQCGFATITARSEFGHEATCSVDVRDIVHVTSVDELQSSHYPYNANTDRTWVYTDETKDFLIVTFDESTYLNYQDVLHVMDGQGNVVFSGSGYDIYSKSILVQDSTVQIRLISGSNTGYYGFRVADVSDTVKPEYIYIDTHTVESTGKKLTPAFDVYLFDMLLTPDVDYTLSYSNNKNVGEATVIFNGKGRCEGIKVSQTFTILPPAAPMTASVIKSGIKLSWTASKGAGNYYLYRSVNGGSWSLLKTLSGSSKSYTDKDTSADNYYQYQLLPFKKVKVGKEYRFYEGVATYCGPITKLEATKLTLTTNQEDGNTLPYNVELKWKKVEGAGGYIIYYSTNGSDYYRLTTTTSSQTSYSINVYDNGKREYMVVPYKYIRSRQLEGAASNVVTAYGFYYPYVYAYDTLQGTVLIYDFTYVEDATAIEVYRSADGGKFSRVKTIPIEGGVTSGEAIDSSSKKSGVCYTYKIRLVIKDGKKTVYGPFSPENKMLYLDAPDAPIVEKVENGMQITWKKVKGAEGYSVWRFNADGRPSAGNMELIYTVTDPKEKEHTLVDYTATEYGIYGYQVRAKASMDGYLYESCYSESNEGYNLTTPELQQPDNVAKGIAMNWTMQDYATGYEVWRSDDGGSKWKRVKTVENGGYLLDTGAKKDGVTYLYKVRAYAEGSGDDFYSDFSNVKAITRMSAPVLKEMEAIPGEGFRVTFSTVTGARSYELLRMDNKGTLTRVDFIQPEDSKAKTCTMEDLDAAQENESYVYQIVAHGEGENAQSSCYAQGLHLGKPDVCLENSDKGIMVYADVDAAEGYSYASEYTIYRSEDGVKWKKLKTVDCDWNGHLVYLDKTAKAGKTYSYQVEAASMYCDAFSSKRSDTYSLTCARGFTQNALVNKREGIALSWQAPKDMDEIAGYRIWCGTDGYNFQVVAEFDADTLSWLDTTAYAALENPYFRDMYSYKVEAIPEDEDALSVFSNIQTILRMPAPYDLQAYTTGEKTAELMWEYTGHAQSFEVRCVSGKTTKKLTVKDDRQYCDVKGLKPGTTYEISVRACFDDDGTKYYSEWSEPFILNQ